MSGRDVVRACPKCGGRQASLRWDKEYDKLVIRCDCSYWWCEEPLDRRSQVGPRDVSD